MSINTHPVFLECALLTEEKEIMLINALPLNYCVVNHSSLFLDCHVIFPLAWLSCDDPIEVINLVQKCNGKFDSSNYLCFGLTCFHYKSIKFKDISPCFLVLRGRTVAQNWARANQQLMLANQQWSWWFLVFTCSGQKDKIILVLSNFSLLCCAMMQHIHCGEEKKSWGTSPLEYTWMSQRLI